MKIDSNYHEVYESERYKKWKNTLSDAYKDYRRQWSENPKNNVVGAFPLHLSLETTNLCNLKCPMCARTMKANKGLLSSGKFMDFGLFKKIIDEGAALGLKAIKPNAGDSEPLLVRNLAEYVGYAKDKGILEIMINTNATLLTPKKSKDLIVAGLDRLLVSFDSPNKEKYEQIRVGASFDNVVRNLNQFIEIRGESLLPILRLSMVRMKDNEAEVDDFIKMWKDKADLLAVLDYQNPRNMDSISRSDYQQEINWDFACAQLWQRLQIRVDGTVTPCCGDYLNELKLGNANDNSISSLWLGERLKTLRELHITKKFYKIPTCYYCGFVRLPR